MKPPALICTLALICMLPMAAHAAPPNIILMMADDGRPAALLHRATNPHSR